MRSLAFALALAAAPLAAETRSVTDDAGRTVEIPVAPQRVIALHDALLTMPAHELGVQVVGTHGRRAPGETAVTVFSMEEVMGTTAEEAGMQPIGTYSELDLEAIRALEPDLILGTEGETQQAEMLSSIAPVYLQRSYSGDVIGNSALRGIAETLGATGRYDALKAEWDARVAEVRAHLPEDPEGNTYIAIMLRDDISVMNGMGGHIQALHDLGFRQPDWVAALDETGFMVPFSSEEVGRLDADLLVILPHYGSADRSEEATLARMSRIAPGWDRFLPAAREGRVLVLDSFPVMTPTYASAHAALDRIEAFLTERPGG